MSKIESNQKYNQYKQKTSMELQDGVRYDSPSFNYYFKINANDLFLFAKAIFKTFYDIHL